MNEPAEQTQKSVRVNGVGRLAQGESLRFNFQRGKHTEEGFVLRFGESLFAFANSCPHWTIDLDYGTGDFYDGELERIVCKNHGALFHPQTGACEWGPCTGASLERFELELVAEGDYVVVKIP